MDGDGDGDLGVSANMAAYVKQGGSLNGQLPLLIFLAAVMGLGKGGEKEEESSSVKLLITSKYLSAL